MAAITPKPPTILSLSNPKPNPRPSPLFTLPLIFSKPTLHRKFNLVCAIGLSDGLDVVPVQSADGVDHPDGSVASMQTESEPAELDPLPVPVVGGFGTDPSGRLSFEGAAGFSSAASSLGGGGGGGKTREEMERFIDRTINAAIALAAASFAITKLLTIDHDYWHVGSVLFFISAHFEFVFCVNGVVWRCF